MNAWPTRPDIALELCQQATAIATRLGHWLAPWIQTATDLRARCAECRAGAIVAPRAFHRAPIRGEAVTFHCEKGKP
jgi:hypothetical protein